ncbi:MAG: hypothetical protein ABSG09_00270 [Acidimicrobiales bacterium]|jgi:hypothetical protein
MLATLTTLTLIPLVLCVGVFVPLLGLHLELAHRRAQRQQHELEAQAALIDEHEATINAYRHAVALEMSELAHVSMPTSRNPQQ